MSTTSFNDNGQCGSEWFTLPEWNKLTASDTCVAFLDLAMQIQPFFLGYLTYTAGRCASLWHEYVNSGVVGKARVLEKVQRYALAKVVGIVISQVALTALGVATFPTLGVAGSVALVATWALVLLSLSFHAGYRAHHPSS